MFYSSRVSNSKGKYMYLDVAQIRTRPNCYVLPGVRLIYLNRNQDSKSWFWFTVLFERIGNRISNLVDHTQFMILSESNIQDGGDDIFHRFIWANQKYDTETC